MVATFNNLIVAETASHVLRLAQSGYVLIKSNVEAFRMLDP